MPLLRPTDYRQPFNDHQPMDEPGGTSLVGTSSKNVKLQEIQDRFAKIMRVGSIITTVDGDPIARPVTSVIFASQCAPFRKVNGVVLFRRNGRR